MTTTNEFLSIVKFDIIITTYNRPQKVYLLVKSLLDYVEYLNNIIVVDSSDICQTELQQLNHVVYIQSSHKNQPYQRYLGCEVATSDWLLFLDDDMELVDSQIFEHLHRMLKGVDCSGIAINFRDKHLNNALSKIPRSVNRLMPEFISGIFRKISFNAIPDTGKIGLFGQRGKQPYHLKDTEIISGGAFLARKAHMFSDFNSKMFDVFEQRLGMGEDTLIGYGLSKKGKVLFYEPISFLHNDETGSHYSLDLKKYAIRVTFSRVFIAYEKKRLDKVKDSGVFLDYSVYVMFRLIGALVSLLPSISQHKIHLIQGTILGYKKAFGYDFSFSEERNLYWRSEVKADLLKFSKK